MDLCEVSSHICHVSEMVVSDLRAFSIAVLLYCLLEKCA